MIGQDCENLFQVPMKRTNVTVFWKKKYIYIYIHRRVNKARDHIHCNQVEKTCLNSLFLYSLHCLLVITLIIYITLFAAVWTMTSVLNVSLNGNQSMIAESLKVNCFVICDVHFRCDTHSWSTWWEARIAAQLLLQLSAEDAETAAENHCECISIFIAV